MHSMILLCDIPIHIVRNVIVDNDPTDGNISLDNCVIQALAISQHCGSLKMLRKALSKWLFQVFIPVLLKDTLLWTQPE